VLDVASSYGVKVEKVLLFGSRARGDYKRDSDWDLLVVTEEKLDRELENELWLHVQRRLVKLGIVPELLIVDKETLRKYEKHTGYVCYYALKEGIET